MEGRGGEEGMRNRVDPPFPRRTLWLPLFESTKTDNDRQEGPTTSRPNAEANHRSQPLPTTPAIQFRALHTQLGIHTISHQSLHYAACSHYPWLASSRVLTIFCCMPHSSTSSSHNCHAMPPLPLDVAQSGWVVSISSNSTGSCVSLCFWRHSVTVAAAAGLSTERHAACSFRPTYGPTTNLQLKSHTLFRDQEELLVLVLETWKMESLLSN